MELSYAHIDPPGTTPTHRQSYGSPMGRVWVYTLRHPNPESFQTALPACKKPQEPKITHQVPETRVNKIAT